MMDEQTVGAGSPDFHTGICVPEALGWMREPERDDRGREAWALPNGTLLLLDPSGREDTLVRPE